MLKNLPDTIGVGIIVASLVLCAVGSFVFAASTQVSVEVAVFECSDALDNDGDVLIDYPADADCASLNDDDESTPPEPEPEPSPAPASSGGGGGFGIQPVIAPYTSVYLQGSAYPRARIFVRRGLEQAQTYSPDSQGIFDISLSSVSPGVNQFSLWTEDALGTRSSQVSLSVVIEQGATTYVRNITLPPTLKGTADATLLRLGGFSIPGIKLALFSEPVLSFLEELVPSADGSWSREFPLTGIANGVYRLYAQSIEDETGSPRSLPLEISVEGAAVIIKAYESSSFVKADMNKDGGVDLVDFSILGYWFEKENPPAWADLTLDGIVDLRDFSVLAYYWSGQ